jgi:hypothetical protein
MKRTPVESLRSSTLSRIAFLVLLGLTLRGLTLKAQTPVGYGGCRDFRGVPVLTLANVHVNDVAVSSYAPDGTPIIQYNPDVLSRFSPVMRRWWYMHECGHHALGHMVRKVPLSQEQESDCYAITTLMESGEFGTREMRQVQSELNQIPVGDWQHLPGPQRAINLDGCQGDKAPRPPNTPESSKPAPKPRPRPKSGWDRMNEMSARESIEEELTSYGDTIPLSSHPDSTRVMAALRQAAGRLENFLGGSDIFTMRRAGNQAIVTYAGPDESDILTGARKGEEVLRFTISMAAGRWKRIDKNNNTWGFLADGRLTLRETTRSRSEDCAISPDSDVALWILMEGDRPSTLLLRTDPIEEEPSHHYRDGCTTRTLSIKRPLYLELKLPTSR